MVGRAQAPTWLIAVVLGVGAVALGLFPFMDWVFIPGSLLSAPFSKGGNSGSSAWLSLPTSTVVGSALFWAFVAFLLLRVAARPSLPSAPGSPRVLEETPGRRLFRALIAGAVAGVGVLSLALVGITLISMATRSFIFSPEGPQGRPGGVEAQVVLLFFAVPSALIVGIWRARRVFRGGGAAV